MKRSAIVFLCLVVFSLTALPAFALRNKCSTCEAGSCRRVGDGYTTCEQGPGYCSAGGGSCSSRVMNNGKSAPAVPAMPGWRVVDVKVSHTPAATQSR